MGRSHSAQRHLWRKPRGRSTICRPQWSYCTRCYLDAGFADLSLRGRGAYSDGASFSSEMTLGQDRIRWFLFLLPRKICGATVCRPSRSGCFTSTEKALRHLTWTVVRAQTSRGYLTWTMARARMSRLDAPTRISN